MLFSFEAGRSGLKSTAYHFSSGRDKHPSRLAAPAEEGFDIFMPGVIIFPGYVLTGTL